MATPSAMAAAFDLLQEEVDAEIARINQESSAAFAAGEHERAAAVLGRARQLKALQGKLDELAGSYPAFFHSSGAGRGGSKLPRGLKTPQDAFRLPILRTLVAMGGSGATGAVLDRVYEQIKDRLNEHDLAPTPSNEDRPRWRNTAAWCRYTLREEDLIVADSLRGVWEISDAGRRAVEEIGKSRG